MSAGKSNASAARIINLFPELLGVGGVQLAGRLTATAIFELVRSEGWSADFLSLNDSAGEHALPTDAGEIGILGFGRAKTRFVRAATRRARNNARIVVAAHPHLALPGALIKVTCPGIKMIVISHGVEVWTPMSAIRRAALRRADLVLAPSRYTAQKLAKAQGITPARIRQLPWPLSPEFLRLAIRRDKLARPPQLPSGPVILTVGRWVSSERYKGLDELIRAVAKIGVQIPNLALVVAGTGDDLPRLRRLAADVKVADRVHFLERIPTEDLAACYAHCDLFALPSTGEGFGLVFLEAMAFAKPVVGADCGGVTDLIEDGVNGLLVPPNDVEKLAASLRGLLGDEPLRARMGSRAAALVQNRYQFSGFKAQLKQIFEECGFGSGTVASVRNA